MPYGKKDTDISIGIHHSLLAQRSSSLSLSLTPSPFPAVLRLILSRLLSTSLTYPLIHPPNPCFCICSPLSRPLSPLRYPPPHGISRLLSFLVRTLPREATTVSSFHLSPFQSFFSTTFRRYVEPHWRLNPYRWLLTEYHGFPRCWTIFATDFRSLVGKLSGGTRRKRERRERRYNKRYINIFIVNIFIVTLFYNRARTLYWVKVVLPDAHMRDGVTRWQN